MSKKLVIVLGLVAMFALVNVASATTVDDLMAQIADLQAQIASMSGSTSSSVTTSSSIPTITTSLTVGSRGNEVSALQQYLIDEGYLDFSGVLGYFGPMTKAAVAAWQTANNVYPPAGYFGPISRAKLAELAVTTTTTTTTTTSTTTGLPEGCSSTVGWSAITGVKCDSLTTPATLEGTDGTIDDIALLSTYSNEEVGEGEEDVKVLGMEIEASNDGDVLLKAMKIDLDPNGNTGSDRLTKYVDTVSIWQGSTKVGSADADDFSQNSNDVYSKTITLDSGVVVEAGETEKFYVTIDAVDNIDSADLLADSWAISVESVKFADGSGVVTTDSSTGDLATLDGDGTPAGTGINFTSFSSAADTELKLSTDSDTPEEGVVLVDDSEDTEDVVLLKGKIKLEGDSDVLLDELPVTLTTTGTAGDAATTTGNVILVLGDEEYSESVSVTIGNPGTVTFDNLDYTIEAGDTVEFTVKADINDIEAGTFDEGDTLKAQITSTNRDYIDAENDEGDQLADATEKSGTATGNAQEFRTEGIQLTLVSTDAALSAEDGATNDTSTFTIKFKVKATGNTVYLSSLASGNYTYAVDKAGTATTSVTITGTLANNTDTSKTAVGNYEIEDGEEETLTLTVTVPNGATAGAGQYRTSLTGVKWDTSDDTSMANTYSSNLDEFQTDYIYMN